MTTIHHFAVRDGSSGEAEAEVYQHLEDPAGAVSSDSTTVP